MPARWAAVYQNLKESGATTTLAPFAERRGREQAQRRERGMLRAGQSKGL